MQDYFHMAHLNRYGPSLNDNIKNVAFLIFFGLPTPSEVSLSRIVSPKKAVFRAFFFRKSCFWPIRPNEDPQVLYMAGKLWISSFWWYKGKNIFLHPAERAIFYDGPHRYFPLYWEAVICANNYGTSTTGSGPLLFLAPRIIVVIFPQIIGTNIWWISDAANKFYNNLKPGSTWSTWVYLGPLGSTWVHLGPPGSTWVNLGAPGPTWVHLDPPGST